ncbi:MAG TPA: phasin family protein [Burkholderiales bacterium]|nr:phasin family protein [Burkholderiales bacterium]
MYPAPEQLTSLNKTNIDAAMRFAGVALQGAQRLIDLQIETARAVLADGASNAKAFSGFKDAGDLSSLQNSVVQPSFEKASTYARGVYDVVASTQAELQKLVDEQVEQFNKNVIAALDQAGKSAPAGTELPLAAVKSAIVAANSAYDNLSKAAKQFAEVTEANIASASQTIAGAKTKQA